MGSLGDDEPLRGDALLLQSGNFLEQRGKVHDHAIAHHTLRGLAQDPRRHQVQRILLPIAVINGVPGISAPL